MRQKVLPLLLFGFTLPTQSIAQTTWAHSERSDEFTGETSYSIEIRSNEQLPDIVGEAKEAVLQLRCDKADGNPYWRLIWPTLLTTTVGANQLLPIATETSQMQVRFDEGRIYGPSSLVGGWLVDKPVGATQSVSTAAVKAVLNQAIKASVMRVRDVTWDGRTLTASFSVQGLDTGVQWLSGHCRRI